MFTSVLVLSFFRDKVLLFTGASIAHYNLELLGLSEPPTLAFGGAETTGMGQYAHLCFYSVNADNFSCLELF